MPTRQLKECKICGNSFDKDNHEYCPHCEEDPDFLDDQKVIRRDMKKRKIQAIKQLKPL